MTIRHSEHQKGTVPIYPFAFWGLLRTHNGAIVARHPQCFGVGYHKRRALAHHGRGQAVKMLFHATLGAGGIPGPRSLGRGIATNKGKGQSNSRGSSTPQRHATVIFPGFSE